MRGPLLPGGRHPRRGSVEDYRELADESTRERAGVGTSNRRPVGGRVTQGIGQRIEMIHIPDGISLSHGAMPQIRQLRKDEPHPVGLLASIDQLFNDLPAVWVPERPMSPNMNLWGHRSFGRPDHPSTGVDVDPAAGGDVEATPLPRQPTFGSPDSRKEPPESAKRNKTRGEISRKYGVNCSRSVADPRSGANKPRILEPVRTILKKSEDCVRHKSCCPDQTWSTGKR